ncbi:hypothetical protein GOP47_0022326 [Adiantum capillus-veneris]|uniref:Uncharacterized protein n=1 Tax=Adiantum capillus-veneris TaxID=13818 RepID=A0A9D4U5J9_ADICA|nr:hypothetical protein GOP47_0022326 [Adiantum capillus-veneris]
MGRGYRNWAAAAPKVLPVFEERAGAGGSSPSSSSAKGASVNVLSLGFAATAILLSLFLLMALFERFLRPGAALSSAPAPTAAPAASVQTSSKLQAPPLPASDPFTGVSVLMPGHSFPTFIANPLPLPISLHPNHPTLAAMQPGSINSHTSISGVCKHMSPTHHHHHHHQLSS